MSFFRKLGRKFTYFMSQRNGMDNLGFVQFGCCLLVQILALMFQAPLLILINYALYGWLLFRIFSKNKAKRGEENRKFVVWSERTILKIKQCFRRVKGMKQYKYFKCPQCKTLLRLNRGAGEKDICCPKCGHPFHTKA